MMTGRILLGFFFMVLFSTVQAQKISATWESDLEASVSEFKSCDSKIENYVNPCSKYSAESVNTVYQLKDFYSEDLDRYLTGSEIVKYLESSDQWIKLGMALMQDALNKAQQAANDKRATVAVYSDEEGIGHMAIVLPGEMVYSGTWNLKVPNSASFFINDQEKSYAGKGLSYAFAKRQLNKVILYERQYD